VCDALFFRRVCGPFLPFVATRHGISHRYVDVFLFLNLRIVDAPAVLRTRFGIDSGAAGVVDGFWRASRAGTRDIGVIQGAGNVANFQVSGGNLVYCGKLTQSELAVNGGNLIQSCDRFDFAGTNAFVSDFSSTFQKLPPTGAPTRVDDEFTFDAAAGVEVNVYDVQAALFDSIQQLNINAPAGVFVVINIDGTTNTFQNFQTTLAGGIDQQHIIYNFYQTTSLTVQDIAVEVCSSWSCR
jgi:choice-of-anchor A domain-containing protein